MIQNFCKVLSYQNPLEEINNQNRYILIFACFDSLQNMSVIKMCIGNISIIFCRSHEGNDKYMYFKLHSKAVPCCQW